MGCASCRGREIKEGTVVKDRSSSPKWFTIVFHIRIPFPSPLPPHFISRTLDVVLELGVPMPILNANAFFLLLENISSSHSDCGPDTGDKCHYLFLNCIDSITEFFYSLPENKYIRRPAFFYSPLHHRYCVSLLTINSKPLVQYF